MSHKQRNCLKVYKTNKSRVTPTRVVCLSVDFSEHNVQCTNDSYDVRQHEVIADFLQRC